MPADWWFFHGRSWARSDLRMRRACGNCRGGSDAPHHDRPGRRSHSVGGRDARPLASAHRRGHRSSQRTAAASAAQRRDAGGGSLARDRDGLRRDACRGAHAAVSSAGLHAGLAGGNAGRSREALHLKAGGGARSSRTNPRPKIHHRYFSSYSTSPRFNIATYFSWKVVIR